MRGVLPWLAGAAALILYLLTLNPWIWVRERDHMRNLHAWIGSSSLSQVARVSEWNWEPEVLMPAHYVVTYPLHWLPTRWVPRALNTFSAVCAALALVLLARAVTLLPHDRTLDQRERERDPCARLSIPLAWLPPVLAVAVCGLQLTFWEHATNGTVAMFDLLLFAYIVRGLLEYRADGNESWLFRAALVYGVGMTNSFTLIGFFPLFIAAIVWLRGVLFFSPRFLGRMALCGLVGMALYLLLPVLASRSDTLPLSFWQALKANLLAQKQMVFLFPRKSVLLLGLFSLVPVLLISIRWASYFGDTSPLGVALTKVMFHFVHAFFLFGCLWVGLDAPLSPRQLPSSTTWTLVLDLPYLPLYFLGALAIGYLSGYFLLVFRQVMARGRRPSALLRFAERLATAVLFALLVLVPVALCAKNRPALRVTNGDAWRTYAAASADALPKNAVVLSDDHRRLRAVQAWLAHLGQEKDYMFLDTLSLRLPGYHRFLQREHAQRWPGKVDARRTELFEPPALLDSISQLAQTNQIFYLHPSFGYYFEAFHLEPHGLVYQLQRHQTNSVLPPRLAPAVIAENEAFWTRANEAFLPALVAARTKPTRSKSPSLPDQLMEFAHLKREPDLQKRLVGTIYSRALNHWGVEMQKLGKLEPAAAYFELAHKLNEENVVAEINLDFNKRFRAGERAKVQVPKSADIWLGKYRTLEQALNDCGPYDEPSLCYAHGYVFLQGGLYRQAVQSFERVRTLVPDELTSRLWLAQLYLLAQQPAKALELTGEIHSHPELASMSLSNRTELLAVETRARFANNEQDHAVRLLEIAASERPGDPILLASITATYCEFGRYTNALALLNLQLKSAPDDIALLANKGFVSIHLKNYDEAIRNLSRVLALDTNNFAGLLNRAIAYLRSDQLDAARKDYETLQRLRPDAFQIYFGLAEIALRRQDTNMAILHYENYLTNAVPEAEETRQVIQRLKALKSESAAPSAPAAPPDKSVKP